MLRKENDMRKIDYGKIRWDATTNWEFCGSKENLREVWERHNRYIGVTFPIEEFGYRRPHRGLAFSKGDVVTYVHNGARTYATVEIPVSEYGYIYIRLPDGHQAKICYNQIGTELTIADIPEELIVLARAEAGKPVDFSKCPLKKQGACMDA